MRSRRDFLKSSALVSLAPLIPSFLTTSLRAGDLKTDDRILVVIQLDGGNDGLNTVIPFADEGYSKNRRELRIPDKDILKLNDSLGLNPGMTSAAKLFEEGRLAIVQGVGYPNPNRSHFESMSIWHHAKVDESQHDSIGWLGRTCDGIRQAGSSVPDSIYLGSEAVPVAIRGRRANPVALENESDLVLSGGVPGPVAGSQAGDDIAAFVNRTVDSSFQAARQFAESKDSAQGTATYPETKLARKLRLVSRLMKLGGGTRIFYASQSGYDTHSAQLYSHRQLLSEFSGALKAFLTDLKDSKLDDRVVVMAFSEFGRRVDENASAGTDHGAAGPVFVAGSPVKGGLVGQHPSLSDLGEGDLKMQVDFRQVYATLLDGWLKVDSPPLLGGQFSALPLIG
ncbi:MAG TPA: DUF1501 domain-containing protein [Caulifigura sp.]|jgi:uncharacterized protein (DUF1501 family)|nr:DUF1501 domain-containing protein [Caulifigura sp.]